MASKKPLRLTFVVTGQIHSRYLSHCQAKRLALVWVLQSEMRLAIVPCSCLALFNGVLAKVSIHSVPAFISKTPNITKVGCAHLRCTTVTTCRRFTKGATVTRIAAASATVCYNPKFSNPLDTSRCAMSTTIITTCAPQLAVWPAGVRWKAHLTSITVIARVACAAACIRTDQRSVSFPAAM